jgi:2-dehydropantoate 2-reductase
MRVVVVGSGAVGLTYGGRLLEAEVSKTRTDLCVEFVARRDYHFLREHGYTLKSPDGSVSFSPRDLVGKIHQSASTIAVPPCGVDWILCCVKSYAFQDMKLRTLLEELVGPSTRILLVMNGLQCEEVLKNWFGANRVYVGMAFTCINRNTPRQGQQEEGFALVNHIAFGSLLVGHSADDERELSELPMLWKGTKIEAKVTVTESLRHAQWSKLCWNIPFSGLSVALGGITTQVIANDPNLRRLANSILTETIDLANADLANHPSARPSHSSRPSPQKLIDKEAVVEHCWRLTDTMGPYVTSTVLDLVAGNMLETEHIFDEPLRRARHLTELGVGGPYPAVEHVVQLVHAVSNIAEEKKRLGIAWVPTHLPPTPR